ncbi:DUF885 domain-containing protein [Kineobactrum salinum]|uniref:DUF885 family protein n=1 Tax=Kineobactrum salinum TaxID=2708301 RepID=A0A6C0TY82_9GAMM|nr:DUF885 family protein [Kineobactrum salinum]QIB64598.1 DUF885 family protein [Kineobactrum salinum]
MTSSYERLSMSRRHFLSGMLAAAIVPGAMGRASTPSESSDLGRVLELIFRERLQMFPELATYVGLDKGDNSGLKHRLNDYSLEGRAAQKGQVKQHLRQLAQLDTAAFSSEDVINFEAVTAALKSEEAVGSQFSYGSPTSPKPYVISHLTGALNSVPSKLDERHTIASRDDAEAYLNRLEAFANALEDELGCLSHDVAQGVIPPDFVLARSIEQMQAFVAEQPASSILVAGLRRKLADSGLDGDYLNKAERIVDKSIMPAASRQLEALTALAGRAKADAGVWRLPGGDKYYEVSLANHTTTRLDSETLHQMGLDMVADLGAQLDESLGKLGMGSGTLSARIYSLLSDPTLAMPDTEQGRRQYLAAIEKKIAEISRRMPRFFHDIPETPLDIRAVPPFLEAGAPAAYYEDPPFVGEGPGVFYIKLGDLASAPLWLITTTIFHEALPGHHLQVASQMNIHSLPAIRKILWSAGYGEGWGLYAEQLADELGIYEDDPLGRIGYLLTTMLRACRLVVDTGLHAKRWGREQAIAWMADQGGLPTGLATNEVERYCVWPGQACSYMVGKVEWLRLRAYAERRLGSRFDIRDFHSATISIGAVPLTVLADVVERYVQRTLQSPSA